MRNQSGPGAWSQCRRGAPAPKLSVRHSKASIKVSRIQSSNGAAVYDDDFTIHERVAIAHHEGCELREFFGAAKPAAGNPELVHLQPPLRKGLGEICIKDARGNGVNRNSEGRRLTGETLRKTNHRRFGCRVVYRGWQRTDSSDGSYVKNCALALPNHLLVNRLSHRKKPVHVCIYYFIPGAIGRGGEIITAIDCGVVDQNVDPAPFVHQLSSQMLHAKPIGDRDFESAHPPSQGLDHALNFFG